MPRSQSLRPALGIGSGSEDSHRCAVWGSSPFRLVKKLLVCCCLLACSRKHSCASVWTQVLTLFFGFISSLQFPSLPVGKSVGLICVCLARPLSLCSFERDLAS